MQDGVYPKRKPFFANRFIRVLAKMCAAQEIGPDSFTLLSVIVMTEDAKGYRDAVTFFNEQLMPMAGFRSVDSLARARKRAIDAGWLHYEPGGKGKPGRYWAVIPDKFSTVDNAPSDEGHDAIYYRTSAEEKKDLLPHQCGEKPETSAEENQREVRKETRSKPETSAEHSSYTENLPLSLSQEREADPEPTKPGGAIERHETAFAPMPFPDRFAAIARRHPNKAPPKRAEAEWKLVATSEQAVIEIETGHAAWVACQQWRDGIGIPSLANFLRERWFENHPEPAKVKPNANEQRKNERTKYRYDPERDG